ncbi:hypothetical protein CEXT_149891, partial [Caerostris extrusa]
MKLFILSGKQSCYFQCRRKQDSNQYLVALGCAFSVFANTAK